MSKNPKIPNIFITKTILSSFLLLVNEKLEEKALALKFNKGMIKIQRKFDKMTEIK